MVAVNSMDPIELKKIRGFQLCLMRVIYVPSEFVEYMCGIIYDGIIYDGIIYVPWLMEFVFLVGTS